ncbi:DNA ligase [Xanthomonas phage FMYAK-P1]|uniref:DNA ligase n=1 Tax=Xanthomonas phage FMYAK-P1 TaxID=2886031 RepID=A0AAE9C9K0_9CAUD|nr:DNA ligase [Xanthomonas phage FMYAK-P1]UGL62723.1 DNA ligase [Xanthomonas phage FMYAK-P1]
MSFRPMLAASIDDVLKLRFPLQTSPKLDGIRCIVRDSVAVSRSLKPIPNRYVQSVLGHPMYNGLDGELIVGDAADKMAFNNTTRGVMSIAGEPDFRFHVFDDVTHPEMGFNKRHDEASRRVTALGRPCVIVPHWEVNTPEELVTVETSVLGEGYEGLMARDACSPYKFGRGTLRAQDLLKLKRFEDGEAELLRMEELMHNANEASTSALGLTERGHGKDNLLGMDTMGALVVRAVNGPFKGVEFSIGTGFTADQRQDLWNRRHDGLSGRLVKYKFFPGGSKDAPRFPVFLGFRSSADM